MTGGFFLAAALVLVAFSIAAWCGRWRAWAWWFMWGLTPLYLFPALGLFSLTAAMGSFWDAPYPNLVVRLAATCVVVALVLTALGAVGLAWQPRFLVPAWYRAEKSSGERMVPTALSDLGGEMELLMKTPRNHSWWANWVYDLDAISNDHQLAGPGSIAGRLELYEAAAAFRATSVERMARGRTTEAVIARESMHAVWTVPAGADAIGERRRKSLWLRVRQSPHRRLVVETSTGTHVFEVLDAPSTADSFAAQYNIERRPDVRMDTSNGSVPTQSA